MFGPRDRSRRRRSHRPRRRRDRRNGRREGDRHRQSDLVRGRRRYRSGASTLFGTRSTRTAQEIAKLAYTTLREHGRSAVDAVVEANTLLSGLGFESGGLAAAHAIHNGLTQHEATHDTTRGEKVTIGMVAQLVLEGREDAFVEDVAGFAASIGLPTTLAGIGLEDPSREDLMAVAEAACAEEETIHNEPFEVPLDDVRDALVGADAIGQRTGDR